MFGFGPPVDPSLPPVGGYTPITYDPPTLTYGPGGPSTGPSGIATTAQPVGLQPGDTWEDAQGYTHVVPGLAVSVATTSAAQLAAQIKAAGGKLAIWTANVAQSPELTVAAKNPLTFAVTRGQQAGEYSISLKTGALQSIINPLIGAASTGSTEPLGGYLPYIALGAGLLVVLTMLKK